MALAHRLVVCVMIYRDWLWHQIEVELTDLIPPHLHKASAVTCISVSMTGTLLSACAVGPAAA